MRAIVTGQIGVDKQPYLEAVVDRAGERGGRIELFHVGRMMYGEAPDVRAGRILDLPLSRLNALRRAAFKDIISTTTPVADHPNVLVNTHATFRWRHGLFSAFDFDQMRKRSSRTCSSAWWTTSRWSTTASTPSTTSTPRSRTAWSGARRRSSPRRCWPRRWAATSDFYILSRGRHEPTPTLETCLRLLTRKDMRKVYPSFPMSHVVDMPDVLAEIDHFRAALAEHFIAFDPADVDEKTPARSRDRRRSRRTRLPRGRAALLRRHAGAEPIRVPCARSSTSPATSTARSTCATSSSSIRPT